MEPLPGDAWASPPTERRRETDELHTVDSLRLEKPAQVRLHLQRRAPENLRRHMVRAAFRFAVLLAADVVAFWIVRAVLRAVRDSALLGESIARAIHAVLPPGIFGGWQFAAAVLVGLFVTGNYGAGDQRRDPRRLFLGAALAAALPLWLAIWTRGFDVVLLQFALVTTLVWVGLLGERLTVDRAVGLVRRPDRDAAETLFIGSPEECRRVATSPAFRNGHEYRYAGFVDVTDAVAPGAIGHVSDFSLLLAASGAEAVVLCGYVSEQLFQEIVDVALAGGCQVLSVPRSLEAAGVQPTLVARRGQALIELTRPTLQGRQLILKRVLDVVGSVVGLVLLAPVFVVIGAAVRFESRGPSVFGHLRLGQNGRAFRCFKFRSMHPEAEERLRSDPVLYAEYMANSYKLPEASDPRLTRVGRWLRRTSLDELPQLVNVIRGDMSLVGPRPIVPEELGEYGPRAAILLSLKPGMTGAWAVNGRSRVGYPERADIEVDYVRRWSLGRDLGILCRTVPMVLMGDGAH